MTGIDTDLLRVGVLGPLQVRRGHDVTPSAVVPRRILTLLAARAPHEVSTDHLVELAWGGGGLPRDPVANIHTHISRLRRVLGSGADGSSRIRTCPGGYRLATADLVIDVAEVDELTRHRLGVVGDPTALDHLTSALACWRGRSLHDIADDPLARSDAARLDELRLTIAEARFECLLASGAGGEAVHELQAFTLDHPYRERPHAVLMEVLLHLGRQAEALETYQRLRTRLVDDLGIEPSPELRALESDVLGQRLTARAAPGGGGDAEPFGASDVPAPTTPIIGREGVLAEVEATFGESRLVTVLGPGGVGKTRLAGEVAARHADRRRSGGRPVVWCDLTTATDDAGVVELVAAALHARRRPDQTTRDAVVEAAASSRPLLVLDNCEQAADAVAALATRLLAGDAHLRLLTTSRSPLDIPGEALLRLRPLGCGTGLDDASPSGADAPAVELFSSRAVAAGAESTASASSRQLVERVCRAVDGLPLGIELAAAQLRNMTLVELAQRLDDEVGGAIDISRRRGPARHRSIRAAFEWSYDLLEPDDQRLLADVSVFPASFTAEAASVVTDAADPVALRDRLRALSDLSLVVPEPVGDRTRFRLLATARQFGRDELVTAGRFDHVSARHRAWVLALVEAASLEVRGPREGEAVRDVDDAMDDIRTTVGDALRIGDLGTALSICCGLQFYGFPRMRDDICDWTERALLLPGADAHELFARASGSLAVNLTSRGDLAGAAVAADRASSAAVETDDLDARLSAYHAAALVALYSGDLARSLRTTHGMLELAEAAGDGWHAQSACMVAALAEVYDGKLEAAMAWAARSVAFARAAGSPTALAWADYGLGEVLRGTAPDEAARCFQRAIARGETVDSTVVIGVAEVSLTTLPTGAADIPSALRTFERLIRRWDRRNDWTHQWTTLENVAPLLQRAGSPAEAAVLTGALSATGRVKPLFGEAARTIARLEADLSAALGEEQLGSLQRRGAALAPPDLVRFALDALAAAGQRAPGA